MAKSNILISKLMDMITNFMIKL